MIALYMMENPKKSGILSKRKYIIKYATVIEIHGEHKRTLHIQNVIESKCGVLRTSHPHQPIEKLSKFYLK